MKVYFNETLKPNPTWGSHLLLIELAFFLKESMNCVLHLGSISKKNNLINTSDYNATIMDCEMLIVDKANDSCKLISFSESPSDAYKKIIENRNNPNDILIGPHIYANWGVKPQKNKFKVHPLIVFNFCPKTNYDYFYYKRKCLILNDSIISQLYFRCTTGRGSENLLHNNKHVNNRHRPMDIRDYLSNLIQYNCGLSIPAGTYEICHRDIEYMSVGLPMIHTEYRFPYFPKLTPNTHYISIENQDLHRQECEGGSKYVERYINKFLEVKDNSEFLNHISHNAYNYVKSFTGQSRLNSLIKLLNI